MNISSRFDIIKELGGGVQGTALLVFDKSDSIVKVLKIFYPPYDYDRENLIKRVSMPPNCVSMIICYYEFADYTYRGTIYRTALMEYFPGKTLEEITKEMDTVSSDILFDYFKVALWGLTHMQERGIYHGDLHDNNMMYLNGTLKIIDLDNIDSLDRYSPDEEDYPYYVKDSESDVNQLAESFVSIMLKVDRFDGQLDMSTVLRNYDMNPKFKEVLIMCSNKEDVPTAREVFDFATSL